MAQPAILTLSDIMLTFGGNPLFEGLNLSVNQGERICLVGRNGSGKSTLLKVMAGIMEPDAGDVFLRPGNAVAYMEQDPDLSAYETLGDYASSGLDPSEYYRVEMVMEGVKLNVDQSPEQASGGERRRAALAKLLASDAERTRMSAECERRVKEGHSLEHMAKGLWDALTYCAGEGSCSSADDGEEDPLGGR